MGREVSHRAGRRSRAVARRDGHPWLLCARGRAAGAGLAVALALGLGAAGCSGVPPAGERSVILVTLDTTRADHLGAYGGSVVPTPILDRIAREGVVFEEAISQVPLTLPAHASMMTGRYPACLGVRHNGIYRLPDSEETLAERLGQGGFATAAFVGAYVLNRGFGIEQGFQTFDDVPVDRYRGGEDQLFLAERSADDTNARVFRWLDQRRERGAADDPFFLWVHYYDPHDPYEPPEVAGRELHGEGYAREISYLDSRLGDLLDRLRDEGVLDRSILAVVADHGESLGEHGERTHGLFLYEGAVRIPFLLRAPGLLPRGERVPGPVELVDVAPTLLALGGWPPLEEAQGRDLRARIDGAEDGRLALAFGESLMPRIEFGWSELRMVRGDRYKYIDAPTPELYDLREDPREQSNLEPHDAETAAQLAGLLEEWTAACEDGAAQAAATRTLSAEEEARLRSLGYLGGDFFKRGDQPDDRRPDPKDMIAEVRALDAARDALAEGDAEEALTGVDRILADNPRNHQARSTRILVLIELDRLAEAEEEALAAVAASQTDEEASGVLLEKARGLLASVYALQGKDVEAEAEYRKLLELDPTDHPIRVDLARLLERTGRRAEATRLLDAVLAEDPRNGMALAARFLIQWASGERAAALQTAERLADERAGDAPALLRAGQLLLEEGQPARAAACFEVGLAQLERPDPEWVGRLGSARLGAGDLDGAERAFLQLADLRGGDPRPHYYLGNIELRRGNERAARVHFDRALFVDPSFVAPLVSLGRWLAAQGRRDEALETLRSAVTRNPGDRRAREELERLGAGTS